MRVVELAAPKVGGHTAAAIEPNCPVRHDAVPCTHLRDPPRVDAPLRWLPRRDGGPDVRQLGRKDDDAGHETPRRVAQLESPGIAIAYWKLHDDAKWVDCL